MTSELRTSYERDGGVLDARGLPTRFLGPEQECNALLQGAGVADARWRALLRVSGEDRITFLQGMVTNDLKALLPGKGVYAALLTIQGRIVTDLVAYLLDDQVWLDLPAAGCAQARESLERFIIADDVEVDHSDEVCPLLVVAGPRAAHTLRPVLGVDLTGLAAFDHLTCLVDGHPMRVAATDYTGARGYTLFGPPSASEPLWNRCRAAGAEPVGQEAIEVMRMEAGIPGLGQDMGESTLIGEAGIESAISYRKGCYLGQEVVERVAARGQVQRRRVGLLIEGEALPPAGALLLRDGVEQGVLTSRLFSPLRGRILGMGYARRESWTDGTQLVIRWTGGEVTARVSPLPFPRA